MIASEGRKAGVHLALALPVTPSPAPSWLEADILFTMTSPQREDETEQRIRALLAQNRSLRAIQDTTGGAAYEAVKAVQSQMVNHAGDTTTS
ncbi:MAG: hypothetical protein ACE5EY_01530 [Anaerolineae bacterium]